MADPNVDDIFNDFEYKVEGKERSKEPVKQDPTKQKFEEKKQEERKKPRETWGDKEQTLKKIEPKSRNLAKVERIGYIAVILVLVVYIGIDFSFYKGETVDIGGEQKITASVITNATDEENEIIETQEEENKTSEANDDEEKAEVEEEESLSGEITLAIGNIDTEVNGDKEDLGYMNKITFTIDNGKDKILTPIVEAFVYDSKNKEDYETKRRGYYAPLIEIKSGEKHTGSILLTPKTWKNLDLEKNIRLTLNSTQDGYITVTNKEIMIS